MRSPRPSTQRLDTLRRIGFAGCTKREMTAANRFMTSLFVGSGQCLTDEGVRARQCMIIESGTVSVQRGGNDIDLLGPGDWIDGDALLSDQVSTATTVALTDLMISAMTWQEFASLMVAVPSVVHAMQRSVVVHFDGAASRPDGVVAVASGS